MSLLSITLSLYAAGLVRMVYLFVDEFSIYWFCSQRIDMVYLIPMLNLVVPTDYGFYLTFLYVVTTLTSFLFGWTSVPNDLHSHRHANDFTTTMLSCMLVTLVAYTLKERETLQKEYDARLKEALEEAERANSAKTTFVSNMSHDMRTPLQSILGLVELLQHTQLNDTQQCFIFSITAACNNLLSVINNVLEYSKLEKGGDNSIKLSTTSFDVIGLCEQVLESVVMLDGRKNVAIEFGSNVCLSRRCINADYRLLNQILTNLVGNAIKFTDAGFVRLSLSEEPERVSQRKLCHFEMRR
jgi:signal transduction histidine kinase